MSFEVIAHPASYVSKFGYLRIYYEVTLDAAKSQQESLKSLLKMFDKTLQSLHEHDSVKNQYDFYKVGTKIHFNNFQKSVHIEFKDPSNLTSYLIMNRLSKMFQSGNTLEIKKVDIVYTVFGKRVNM